MARKRVMMARKASSADIDYDMIEAEKMKGAIAL